MTTTMKHIQKRLTLLCIALMVCALPAIAQEDSRITAWEAIWETDPRYTVTLQNYRDDPEASMDYFVAHLDWDARKNNGHDGLPSEQQMPVQDAVEATLAAIIDQCNETEESLANYRISPSFVIRSREVTQNGVEFILPPPLWQIDFESKGPAGDEYLYYCAYIDPDTGEILILHGSEVSYG